MSADVSATLRDKNGVWKVGAYRRAFLFEHEAYQLFSL
jgi:hypothetical protein